MDVSFTYPVILSVHFSLDHLTCFKIFFEHYVFLLEKLTGSAASQEIPRILRNPKVHYRTHKWPPSLFILSELPPVPTTPSKLLKIHLNIILPSTSGSPQWSISLMFPHQNPVNNPSLPHTRNMPRPSHSSRFYHPHNIG